MSMYWSRKLERGYVWYESKFRKVVSISLSDIPENTSLLYPEDYIPYMQLHFEGTEMSPSWPEVQVRFPEERYARVKGSPIWGERKIVNDGWKIVPSDQSYDTRPYGLFNKWIVAPKKQTYDSVDEILTTTKDLLLSPTLAIFYDKDIRGDEDWIRFQCRGVDVLQFNAESLRGEIMSLAYKSEEVSEVINQLEVDVNDDDFEISFNPSPPRGDDPIRALREEEPPAPPIPDPRGYPAGLAHFEGVLRQPRHPIADPWEAHRIDPPDIRAEF